MFVSIDLVGPKETFLSIAQKMSKYIADPYKWSPDIFHVR